MTAAPPGPSPARALPEPGVTDGPGLDDLLPDFGAPPAAAPPAVGRDLDPTRAWRTGVAERHPLTGAGLYARRFAIAPADRIAIAGGGFARHIGAHLRDRGHRVLDLEPAPAGLDPVRARAFGYGIGSARFGEIDTARGLLELLREATAPTPPPPIVRERGGRFFDAARPGVEPEGLGAPEEVAAHRHDHLAQVRRMFATARVFVFTLGRTETWRDRATGRTLPIAPGASFDPAAHAFHNFTAAEVLADCRAFRAELAELNPGVRHLVTVAPEPPAATATEAHVLVAATYSAAALRAAAGQLADEHADVDYFPAYEIVTAPWSRGVFFEPDLRTVSPAGVAAVMRVFLEAHAPQAEAAEPAAGRRRRGKAGKRGADAGREEHRRADVAR